MGTLFFVCPATGLEVSTGLVIGDQATLRRLRLEKVNCPHCGAPHEMAGIRAWLSRYDEIIDILPDEGMATA